MCIYIYIYTYIHTVHIYIYIHNLYLYYHCYTQVIKLYIDSAARLATARVPLTCAKTRMAGTTGR